MQTPKLTQDKIDVILFLSKIDLFSRRRIAEKIGVSKTTVYNYQVKNKII